MKAVPCQYNLIPEKRVVPFISAGENVGRSPDNHNSLYRGHGIYLLTRVWDTQIVEKSSAFHCPW
jgi:hypothetical protein